MMEECRYCDSERTVPVLDRSAVGPHGGNPYRARCLDCRRWLPMTDKETFRKHLRPHVLPKGVDAQDDGEIVVPIENSEESGEWADVMERIENYRDRERPYATWDAAQQAVTDGGEEVDDDEGDDVEEVNRFPCPGCEETVEGRPDECPHCGAEYNW